MLSAIELYLSPFVAAAVPAGVEVVRGPFLVGPPWAANRRVVSIHATRLDPNEVPPPKTADRPAFSFQTIAWPIGAGTNTFTLPAVLVGDVVEVEAPLGHLATPGDDYYLEDGVIYFFRAPTGPGQVLARVRTAAANGHARRSAATLTLDINAHSRTPATADPLLEAVLQVVLVQLTRAPYFALASVAGINTLVRFCDFRPYIRHLERDLTTYENVVACSARLELEGELDLLVSTGAAAPADVIESIEGEVAVEGGPHGPSWPDEIHIDGDGA